MMGAKSKLDVLDIVVFGGTIIITLAIGIYHSCKERRKSTDEFLMAERSLKVLPLTLSLVVSVISAITLLGLPAEMYTQGSQYFFNFGSGLGILLTALIFVPLLHPLQLTSMFEYLERRYESQGVRLLGSLSEVLALLLYGGTTLYAPATGIVAVTGLPLWIVALSLCGIVTFYTALGGLRAVVWTDVFQSVIMLLGILSICIMGTIYVGGIKEVFLVNQAGGRLEFYNFSVDPTVRHTFWGLSIGFGFGGLAFYGASQFTFQRFSATKKMSDARKVVLLNFPSFYLFHIMLCFIGLLTYAFYAKVKQCDPIQSGQISSSNQLLPRLVLDTLGTTPGLTGLFMAALTSGATSTMSSVLNSIAALVWQDVLLMSKLVPMSRGVMVNKLIVCIAGLLTVGLTFVAHNFGPHIFQVCFALLGATGGPQLGLFLLGALIPCANKWGAYCGCMAGLALNSWIAIGAYITKPFSPPLPPAPSYGCSVDSYIWNTTLYMTSTDSSTLLSGLVSTGRPSGLNEIFWLYRISYTWYSAIGCVVCILVGLIVSFITGGHNPPSNLVLTWWKIFCKAPEYCEPTSYVLESSPEKVPTANLLQVHNKEPRQSCIQENSDMLLTDAPIQPCGT